MLFPATYISSVLNVVVVVVEDVTSYIFVLCGNLFVLTGCLLSVVLIQFIYGARLLHALPSEKLPQMAAAILYRGHTVE